MQKEVEKHFTRGELRRVAGERGRRRRRIPARVTRELRDAICSARSTSRRSASAQVPDRRRLRLLGRVVRPAARARPARRRGGRGARVPERRRRGRRTGSPTSIGQAKRLVAAVGADLGAVFDRAGERLYLVDEQAQRGAGRAGAAALPAPDRLERPPRQARVPGDGDEPGRPARRGLGARDHPHARLARRR